MNGLEFVQYSCEFVSVNIMGTPQTEDDNRPAAEDNLAFIYWSWETDPAYLKALELYAQGMIR